MLRLHVILGIAEIKNHWISYDK